MVAGLLGGPYVGLGAGIIGAAYRLSLGLHGLRLFRRNRACRCPRGFIYLANRKQFPGIWVSVSFAAVMECLHMVLVPIMCSPFPAAMEVVSQVAIPMILANSAGMFIFAFIISNLRAERKTALERDGLLREIERKNTELRIAAEIQQSFLPETIAPVRGFDIAAKSIPAREVGGFLRCYPLRRHADEAEPCRDPDRRCLGKGNPRGPLHGIIPGCHQGECTLASRGIPRNSGCERNYNRGLEIRDVRHALLRGDR